MKPIKLLNHIQLYGVLARYAFKKDIPPHLLQVGRAIAASFGLWGNWYIVRGVNGLVTNDGQEMPFHEARIQGIGHVIGPRDLIAADSLADERLREGWRESMQGAMEHKIKHSQA